MPIRIRLLLLILVGFCSLFLTVRYYLHNQMEDSFLVLEEGNAREAMDRVLHAIEGEKHYLEAKVIDWAIWDDTFKFVNGLQPNYLQENIPDPLLFLKNLRIDFFMIIDNDGKVHASGFRKGERDNRLEPVSDELLKQFWSELKDLEADSKTDLTLSEKGPLIYTTSRIRKSSGDRPSVGHFVIGSFAQTHFANKLSEFTKLKLELNSVDQNQSSDDEAQFQISNDAKLSISKVVKSSNLVPVFNVSIHLQRKIFSVFLKTSKSIEFGLLIVMMINFLVGTAFILWQVLRPLSKYVNWQTDLSRSGKWKGIRYPQQYKPWKWLGPFQHDEFNDLIQSTNSLLNKVEESEALIEKQTSVLVVAEKFRSLGEMSAGLAHEINNPLAIVLANTTRAKRIVIQNSNELSTAPDFAKILEKIESNCLRISKIVSGLLSFSRNSSRDQFVRVAAGDPIHDGIELMREKIKYKNIKLEVNIEESLYISVRPGQITQVIYNLINNAFAENENKENAWIRVNCFLKDTQVRIEVIDSGHGIPKSVREKIMEPFFTTKEVGKGTGLGLSISLGIIQEHKGTLFVDDQHPNTCFVIELPKSADEAGGFSDSNSKKFAS